MRVLVIGHSYVKYLERLGGWDNVVEILDDGEWVDFQFKWLSFPGKDFDYFVQTPAIFEKIQQLG